MGNLDEDVLAGLEEFVYRADLDQPLDIGTGPFGNRMFFGLVGGRVDGADLHADVLGGGDWVLIGPDGFGRIDVRGQWRTDDGAAVYVQYTGLIEMNEAVAAALQSSAATDYDSQYFWVTLRFETGDQRYSWLHRYVHVARGRLAGGAIEFTVFRLG
ncbi:DUF3237 domain-containing protein [Saccharopolyspora sp. SCSIO 74807]|uniref:DUF3237 domain-containing protein n=1 Tax=Saccharopolyspora sp. SCSIO 74807 TaxID=3118084 RepID=UPI0030CDDC95